LISDVFSEFVDLESQFSFCRRSNFDVIYEQILPKYIHLHIEIKNISMVCKSFGIRV